MRPRGRAPEVMTPALPGGGGRLVQDSQAQRPLPRPLRSVVWICGCPPPWRRVRGGGEGQKGLQRGAEGSLRVRLRSHRYVDADVGGHARGQCIDARTSRWKLCDARLCTEPCPDQARVRSMPVPTRRDCYDHPRRKLLRILGSSSRRWKRPTFPPYSLTCSV